MRRRELSFALAVVAAIAAGCNTNPLSPRRVPHEVWLVDQSDSPGATYGGRIYIYEDSALSPAATSTPTPTVIDLAQATSALCMSSTGANPVRPHMLLFNATQTHAVLAFVASGHVAIFNASTRTPLACFRTSVGAGGARQAHAAIPSADGSFILVANQNGKLLERIDANYATNSFTLNPAATLNLVTCTTPSGAPCESPTLRPDNAPICPLVDSASTYGFVSLRGGGLFVVNPKATPMAIVGQYDRATVHGNGCGGLQTRGFMYVNSGGGHPANLSEFDVYRFPLTGYAASNAVNAPAPSVLFSDDARDRDSHGLTATIDGRYLWVVDRVGNMIEIFDIASNAHIGTLNLAGPMSTDAAPDLIDISPTGDVMYTSLRGPTPLSGDPHSSTGATPGLGVINLSQGGRTGTFSRIVRITNRDAVGVEKADPHGIRVRRK
jgi:hypothetical protein